MGVNELGKTGDRLLVVFDGYCGLCNRSVRWLVARDRGDRMRFVESRSEKVTGLLARYGFDAMAGPGTILVVRGWGGSAERVLTRSDAVVALLHELPRPWPQLGTALGLVPRAVRDLGYALVARWRYQIWGRLENCSLPGAEERRRFL